MNDSFKETGAGIHNSWSGTVVAAPSVPLSQRHWFADACLLMTTLIWGVNIVIFKYAIGLMNPVLFNAIRLVFALIALWLCVAVESRYRKSDLWPRSTDQKKIPWQRVFWFCLLSGYLYIVLYLNGIDRTTAGNTALILSSMPVWTAMLSFVFLRERLPRIAWIGFMTTTAGTVTVTMLGSNSVNLSSSTEFVGNLLMVGAAFCWASSTVLAKTILGSMTPLQLTFIASLVTTPIHAVHAGWYLWVTGPDAQGDLELLLSPLMWMALIFSGAFSTGIAYALWNTGVKILGGSHAAVFQNIVTVVAVLGGWLFLKERPLAGQIIGGFVIFAGVLIMRRGRR